MFVAWYGVTWGAGFGVCWTGVTLSGLDDVELLRWLGAEQVIDLNAFSPRVVNALIAAEINELAEPIRLPLVLVDARALTGFARARLAVRQACHAAAARCIGEAGDAGGEACVGARDVKRFELHEQVRRAPGKAHGA